VARRDRATTAGRGAPTGALRPVFRVRPLLTGPQWRFIGTSVRRCPAPSGAVRRRPTYRTRRSPFRQTAAVPLWV